MCADRAMQWYLVCRRRRRRRRSEDQGARGALQYLFQPLTSSTRRKDAAGQGLVTYLPMKMPSSPLPLSCPRVCCTDGVSACLCRQPSPSRPSKLQGRGAEDLQAGLVILSRFTYNQDKEVPTRLLPELCGGARSSYWLGCQLDWPIRMSK